jgi:hypothetical protein
MSDDLIERLNAARPAPPSGLLEPNPQLLEEILMTELNTPRRVVTPLRLASVAAIAAALVAVLLVVPRGGTATLNMQAIAESTSAAFDSGRAHVVHRSETDKAGPMPRVTGADFIVEFSGDNRSMYGTIDPGERGGEFPIANKIVNGQFYLQDGQRWVEDTNASNMAGTDVFNVDPRNFLDGVAQAAQFEEVGEETVSGVRTRHLRATRLDDIPDFNLGLGPKGETELSAFELWVDDDDVVRGLLVKTSQRLETFPNAARAELRKNADGTYTKFVPEGQMGEPVYVQMRTSYKVDFTDIGAPIDIKPPADAVPVAGKG